jgi:TonB-linked SusC/RagA family outer membrane protein
MRHAWWVLVGIALSVTAASAQEVEEVAMADRAPRFLMNSASGPAPVDVNRTSVLRRRISLALRDVTLGEALDAIARQSGLRLGYSRKVVPVERVVRLVAEDITVAGALSDVLFDTGVDVFFERDGQAAIVRRGNVPGQGVPGVVRGRVMDSTTSAPLAEVTVYLEGTRWRTATREDGGFVLADVLPGSYTLVARRIGYAAYRQAVALADSETVDVAIALSPRVTTLDEVVVTATGELRRAEIANAIAHIAADSTIAHAPVRDLGDLIAGRAPGVQVVFPNGLTGSAPAFRIRGLNSFTVANDPIVIVDGVRVENSTANSASFNGVLGDFPRAGGRLADLDPAEIEKIDVVKGPSAATLYGTDAANGAIVITTKRGTPGPTRWVVRTEQGMVKPPVTDWWTNYYAWGHSTTTGAVQQCLLTAAAAGQCVQDSLTTFNPILGRSSPLGTGYRQVWGVQVSAGSDQLRYFVSGDLERETGYVKLNELERRYLAATAGGLGVTDDQASVNAVNKVNLRANLSSRVGKTGDVTLSAGFVRNRTLLPTNAVFGVGAFGRGTADTLTQWFAPTARPGGTLAATNVEEVSHVTGSLTGTWRPRSWLAAHATVGTDISANQLLYLLPRGQGSATPLDGRRLDQNQNVALYSADIGVTALSTPMQSVSSRSSVGVQYNRRMARLVGAVAQGLAPGGQTVTGAASATPFESNIETIVAGSYIEEVVGYRDRLFVTGALRADGGSAFGTNFETAVYPKLSASWIALDPGVGREVLGLTSLRVRIAYGQSGVQPSPVAALARDSTFTAIVNGLATNGAALAALGNANLKPERQVELEAGLDADALNGRVHVELTFYNRQSRDALINQPLAPSFGLAGPLSRQINVGEVRNRGIEGLLNLRLLTGPRLSWELTLNGYANQNRLRKLAPGVSSIGTSVFRQVPGYPVNGMWDRPILGYSDANGNGIIEPTEVTLGPTAVYLGSSVPTRELTASTVIALLEGRLRLSALVDYRGDYKRWNNVGANRCFATISNCREVNDPSAPLDRQAAAVAFRSTLTWTGYLEDGTFARLREVSAAYAEPRLARVLHARAATLVVAARNLATWTRYRGIDPEGTNVPGVEAFADNPTAPPARHFIVRLTLGY